MIQANKNRVKAEIEGIFNRMENEVDNAINKYSYDSVSEKEFCDLMELECQLAIEKAVSDLRLRFSLEKGHCYYLIDKRVTDI